MNFRHVIVMVGVLAGVFQMNPVLAWDRDDHDRFDHRGRANYYHDYPRFNHGWGYRYRDYPRFGVQVNFIPYSGVSIFVRGGRYYYADGLYYTWDRGVYVLVPPPLGAIVPTIPLEFRPVLINGVVYYVDNGVYYVSTPLGYQVVYPPRVHTMSGPVLVTQTGSTYAEAPHQTKLAEGAGLGGVVGAIIGGVIGHQQKGHHEAAGALLGGLAGATAGGIIGSQIPNENAAVSTVVRTPLAVVPEAVTPAPVSPGPVREPFDKEVTVNIPDNHGGYIPVVIKRSGSGFVGPQGEFYEEFPKVSELQLIYAK